MIVYELPIQRGIYSPALHFEKFEKVVVGIKIPWLLRVILPSLMSGLFMWSCSVEATSHFYICPRQ